MNELSLVQESLKNAQLLLLDAQYQSNDFKKARALHGVVHTLEGLIEIISYLKEG